MWRRGTSLLRVRVARVAPLAPVRALATGGYAADSEPDGPVALENAGADIGAGSWYNPNSIESRLSRKRNKVAGVGRTKPPPSEEELRLAGGQPGFADTDLSVRADSAGGSWKAAEPVAPGGGAGGGPEPAPKKRLPGWAALLEQAMGGEESGAVRVSQAKVAKSALPSFVQTYKLLVLPVLASHDACVCAKLLVSRSTDQEREGVEDAALDAANKAASERAGGWTEGVGGRRVPEGPPTAMAPETVTVTSVTEWTSEAALRAASTDAAYTSAMRQLSTYMRGAPTSWEMNEAAGMERKRKGGEEAGNGVQEPAPGPELGLR